MESIPPRAQYSSDGKATWALLPMALLLSLAAAAAVGWVFQFVFFHGFYWFIVAPAFGGFALAGALYPMIRWTRCRNRWVAGALGLIVGITTYAGYYEFCMIRSFRHNAGWRVDLLPRYILHRLKTDVVRSTHEIPDQPNQPKQRKTPSFPLNCVYLGVDVAILLAMTTGLACKRAGYAYSPELGNWMQRESATWPAGSSPRFLAAFNAGKLMEFVAKTPVSRDRRVGCRLTLEYAAPADGSPLSYPVFATLADAQQRNAWLQSHAVPVTLLRQVALLPAETLALRPLFPKLKRLLATQHPELAALSAKSNGNGGVSTGFPPGIG